MEFNAPIYLHANDRRRIVRDSPWVRLRDDDTTELTRGVKMIRLGEHFADDCVLHWARDEGVAFPDGIAQVTSGVRIVSFTWSYPSILPLPATIASDAARRLRTVKFK